MARGQQKEELCATWPVWPFFLFSFSFLRLFRFGSEEEAVFRTVIAFLRPVRMGKRPGEGGKRTRPCSGAARAFRETSLGRKVGMRSRDITYMHNNLIGNNHISWRNSFFGGRGGGGGGGGERQGDMYALAISFSQNDYFPRPLPRKNKKTLRVRGIRE